MAIQKVAIAIHEGVQALDVAGPVDVFAKANGNIAPEDRYETVLVGANLSPRRASNRRPVIAPSRATRAVEPPAYICS